MTDAAIVAIPVATDAERQMAIDTASSVAHAASSPIVGYVVMSFHADGTTTQASYRPNPVEHLMGHSLFNAWARQALEDQLEWVNAQRAARATPKES